MRNILRIGVIAASLMMVLKPASAIQYIFLNRAPGRAYDQNRPETISDALFEESLKRVNLLPQTSGIQKRRLGLSFILSYLDGPPDAIEKTLRRLLDCSLRQDVPVLIVLDGQNWWRYRSDLWNWWDPQTPGYNPNNTRNVEWTGWGEQFALKIAWRNWGRQIRVQPPPNLASPRFRTASKAELKRLTHIIHEWSTHLPPEKRDLFPGVKIGWEASLGINAYYYPGGNALLEQFPHDDSHDPRTGLDMKRDFAGGLAPLGYAALQTKGWKRSGQVTLADQERITQDYLAFLSYICRQSGLKREQVWTHAGGQFAPWDKHLSHAVAINSDSLPGWSLYGLLPQEAGDLGASLSRAGLQSWAAAEWLPNAHSALEWQSAFNNTLNFRDCRYVSLYNWEGIQNDPEALEGLRLALKDSVNSSNSRTGD